MLNFLIGSIQVSRWVPQSGDTIRIIAGWHGGYFGRIISPAKKPGTYVIRLDRGGEVVVHCCEMEAIH